MGDFQLVTPQTGLLEGRYSTGDVFGDDSLLGFPTNTGVWVLIVNGQIKAKNAEKIMERLFLISFKMHGQSFDILAERNSAAIFEYTLSMDGHKMQEIREKVEISLDEPIPSKVEVMAAKLSIMNGKVVTYFPICTTVEGGERVTVERRYSDFVALDGIVQGLTGHHLRSTLPRLPGKVLNPFFDQKSDEFLRERQQALHHYVKDLLTNSKVVHYTEVFCFLGLDPITCAPLDTVALPDNTV